MFASKAQRAWMHKNKPAMAKKLEQATPKNAPLPERKGPTEKQKAMSRLSRGMAGKKR
jgi:hypothetical protein